MTARELRNAIREAVSPLYEERECEQIALLVAAHLAGLGTYTAPLLADPEREVAIEEATLLQTLKRLAAGHPMQYILGETDFYGRTFRVDERVLIPRPETEELAHWIIGEEQKAARLLDIGTGSGCLAITLDLEMPTTSVSALDISTDALAIARHNNQALGARVDFRQGDALQPLEGLFEGTFDVIVSNPPYVPESDKAEMHTNVLDHEPHLALFVPDEDILRFYRAIAQAGAHLLSERGALYFEIYHRAADQLVALMEELGYHEITLRRDLQDKPRMLCCRKKR